MNVTKLIEKRYHIDRDKKIQERLGSMPESFRITYKKATKKKSMRSAVNALCQECTGYQRKDVTLCTDLACPLYMFRPYQKIVVSEDDTENAG